MLLLLILLLPLSLFLYLSKDAIGCCHHYCCLPQIKVLGEIVTGVVWHNFDRIASAFKDGEENKCGLSEGMGDKDDDVLESRVPYHSGLATIAILELLLL